MPRILISNKVSPAGIGLLEQAGHELVYAPDQKPETIRALISGCTDLIRFFNGEKPVYLANPTAWDNRRKV